MKDGHYICVGFSEAKLQLIQRWAHASRVTTEVESSAGHEPKNIIKLYDIDFLNKNDVAESIHLLKKETLKNPTVVIYAEKKSYAEQIRCFEYESILCVNLSDFDELTEAVLWRHAVFYRRQLEKIVLLEKQLSESKEMKTVGQISSGIVHDFNNYLTIILNYCELILSSPEVPDHVSMDVEQVKLATVSLSDLTKQILSFARPYTPETPEIIDSNMVIHELEKILRSTMDEKIRIDLKLSPDICLLSCNSTHLKQVILNLAINARDAMPNGGVLEISTKSTDNDHVAIEVKDTGSGIDEKYLKVIFEPFFSTKSRGKGTGLGLSIVKSIVEKLSGKIEVESKPGNGTLFRIILPKASWKEDAPVEASVSIPASKGETVLLVEDDHKVIKIIEKILLHHGYKVLHAQDAQTALQIVKNYPVQIDLILMDMILPNMSGKDLAMKIKEIQRSIKIIFMSGYPKSMLERSQHLTANDSLISKPFGRDYLLTKVSNVLNS